MTEKNITRRKFLIASGVTVGVSAAACCGVGALATRSPQSGTAPQVETASFTYGDSSTMNQRILVTYATRTGSTVGVASAVAETLATRGFSVDVRPVKENPSTTGYQAVLIGSAVNGGQWLPEAVEFVKNNQQALNQTAVALFCVHIMNLGEDEKSRKNRLAYLDNVRPLLNAGDEAYFAGMGMDPEKDSWIMRWVAKKFNMSAEGDCRDWDKIRAWAQSLEA